MKRAGIAVCLVALVSGSVSANEMITNEDLYKAIGGPSSGMAEGSTAGEAVPDQAIPPDSAYPKEAVEEDDIAVRAFKLDFAEGVLHRGPLKPGDILYYLDGHVARRTQFKGIEKEMEAMTQYKTTYTFLGAEDGSLKVKHEAAIKTGKDLLSGKALVQDAEEFSLPLNEKNQALLRVEGQGDKKVYFVSDRRLLVTITDAGYCRAEVYE